MTRRRLVALVSAAVLITLGLVAVVTVFFVTHTSAGRDKLRRDFFQPLIARAVHGSVYLGRLSGNLLTSVTIDTIAIRDERGVLFLSTGPVTLSYNPRDLIDNRIYIRRAEVEHPYVHLIQHEDGGWNYKEIFASKRPHLPKPKDLQTRNLGDYIVADSTHIRAGTFILSIPWHPDDSLHGARRDSAIRVHLNTPSKGVAKTYDGYARTYTWTSLHGLVRHARLADPDSDRKFGQQFVADTLSVDEHDPPFQFRNLSTTVRHLGDSLWLNVPHFDLPASTGSGSGKVVWGSGLPVRYDVAVHGDSVALNDVSWVYPTLPRTGGGSVELTIRSDQKDPSIINYELARMDMRSTASHLTGDMTFGVGAPVLEVRDVNLRANPVDFDLLRTLAGKPFPEDWQGQLYGNVKGRGGPLTHFVVDQSQIAFHDAHVRGAVSTIAGHGELNILEPALTEFHGFDANVGSLDLRTIEYLFPSFPRLRGTISGTATLDSSWLDVRFSNADIVHHDGPGAPTELTGSGRVTYGTPFMSYDVTLDAAPLSLTALSRSYPGLPLRGLVSGPIRAKGSSPDLDLALSLQGPGGGFSFDGHVDIDSIGGYAANGHGDFSNVDLATTLEGTTIPVEPLSGHYSVNVAGASAASLVGSANLDLERTRLDSILVYPSHASVRFADGRMLVDSLRLHTKPAMIVASGAIGLPHGRPDSLRYTISIDSLGGLRPYLSHSDTTLEGEPLPADSLSGAATLSGVASGTLDSLNLFGRLLGNNLVVADRHAASVSGGFDLRDVLRAPSGILDFRLDTAVLAGVSLDSVGARVLVQDQQHAQFAAAALSHNGPTIATTGTWSTNAGTHQIRLDSLGIGIGESRWHLAGPADLAFDTTSMRLDSLVLRNRDSAVVSLSGAVPNAGAAQGRVRISRLPLADFGTLAQMNQPISGFADLSAVVTGTKLQPQLVASATLSNIEWDKVKIDNVTTTARYADDRLNAGLTVARGGQTALSAKASLPIAMTLFSTRLLGDTLSATIQADTTDLSVISPLLGGAASAVTGRLTADVRASGTWRQPAFGGYLSVLNGSATIDAAGVTATHINGRLDGLVDERRGVDSIRVQLRASSEGEPAADSVSLNGWVKNLGHTNVTPTVDLSLAANSFHALDKRSLADLYLSTTRADFGAISPLRLTGPLSAPVLRGNLLVDRGSIYLQDRDLARKQAVELFADTTTSVTAPAEPTRMSQFMSKLQIDNVNVALGEDVRLRSTEADVRLGGQLTLLTSSSPAARSTASSASALPGLALEGQLKTNGGTFNLNLGLVQREFQVLPNGVVTFDGPPENPILDIRAQYNVKQYQQRDLGVIVNLHGRVPNQVVSLSSNADYEISTSDLVSYLLTGKPGLDFGANSQASQVLASFLLPTLSAVAADQLRQSLGSWVDALQIQLGTGSTNAGTVTKPQDYLAGSTIGAEKQVTNNVFLSVNTSFCQITNPTGQGAYNPLAPFGAKVEYRFDPTFSLQLGREPDTNTRFCNSQQGFTGLYNTPQQFSLSLSRTWRF